MSKLYYSPTHEYVNVDGNVATIGVSPYAAKQLGNVVFVDMPDVDDELAAGEEFGAIESVKAASDLFSPVSGTVVEINENLVDNPNLINKDALENWIVKVELSDPAELESLLDQAAYDKLCAEEH
jgi:glycine cleavage system H protein